MAEEVSKPECALRYNSDNSKGSGLLLLLHPTVPQDNIGYRAQRVINGVSVSGDFEYNCMTKHM